MGPCSAGFPCTKTSFGYSTSFRQAANFRARKISWVQDKALCLSEFWLDRAEEDEHQGTTRVSNTGSSLLPHTAKSSGLHSASQLSLELDGNKMLRNVVRNLFFLAFHTLSTMLREPLSETTVSCIDMFCDNSGLKLHRTLHTLIIQQLVLKPVIRLCSKGNEVILQIRKVVFCLLLKAFLPRCCPWSSITELLTSVLLWASPSQTH